MSNQSTIQSGIASVCRSCGWSMSTSILKNAPGRCGACGKKDLKIKVLLPEFEAITPANSTTTPDHYQSSTGVTPWDLQRGMKSSGNAFVDGRRCDAIKYAFRVKQNMAEDLRKAAHCLMEAVAVLENSKLEDVP